MLAAMDSLRSHMGQDWFSGHASLMPPMSTCTDLPAFLRAARSLTLAPGSLTTKFPAPSILSLPQHLHRKRGGTLVVSAPPAHRRRSGRAQAAHRPRAVTTTPHSAAHGRLGASAAAAKAAHGMMPSTTLLPGPVT